MVTEMLKNCIPMEAIIMAIRSFERAMSTRHVVDRTAENRRAWDREYRRKLREKSADPPDIHPTPPDVGNTALPSLEEVKKLSEVVNKKEKKERGCKIPPDWKPNEKHYEYGSCVGMSRRDVDDCADRMRHWCAANSNRQITTKSNWDSAFTGAWLLKDRGNGKTGNGHEKLGYSGLAAQLRQRISERENVGPPAAEPDADDSLPFR
jgi:hypothetical protein